MDQSCGTWANTILTLATGSLLTLVGQWCLIMIKRHYQLKDDEKKLNRDNLLSNVEIIEKTEKENLSTANEILTQITEFSNGRLDAQTVRNGIAPVHVKLLYLSSMSTSLPNRELSSLLSAFESKYAEFITEAYKELSSVNKDKKDSLLSNLGKLYGDLESSYWEINVKVSEIKNNPTPSK